MPSHLKRGAGKLTKRVTIQEYIPNATNGRDDGYYQAVKEIWASIEPLSGRELFQAQQVQSQSDHTIRHRFVPWLKPEHRYYYFDRRRNKDRFFNIDRLADDPDSSGTYQEATVREWTEAPTDAGPASA